MATYALDVYVKLPSGRNAQFDMMPHQTIQCLQIVVAKEENVLPHVVRFKYQGKTLKSTSTLNYLGVRAETILKAEYLESRTITLICKHDDKTTTEISINYTFDTLANPLDKIISSGIGDTGTHVYKPNNEKINRSSIPISEFGLSDGDVLRCTDETASHHPTSSPTETVVDPLDLMDLRSCFDAGRRNVEVAFSFDTTGSMYACLDTVRQKLESTCKRLVDDIPNIRISLIAHGDYCNQASTYVIRMVDFTSDVQSLVRFAQDVPSTGGGDTPGCYEWVLRKAQGLDWTVDSTKALVIIGDCPPRERECTDQLIDWHKELDVLVGMGIKVYGVHANGDGESKTFYQELADRSGGSYLPFLHFDAITDMCLAVCYKEANDNQLENFVQEIEDAGEMTEAKKAIFEQLEKPQKEARNQIRGSNKSYIWWNSTKHRLHFPKSWYYYNVWTDTWQTPEVRKNNNGRTTNANKDMGAIKRKSTWRRFMCLCSKE